MIFRKAKITDVKQMHQLINFYAHKHKMLARSLNELYENIRDFFVAAEGQKIIACGALHISWDNLAEVKAFAVDPKYKRRGIGTKLLEHCLKEAESLDITRVFALTFNPEFFSPSGFRRVKRELLPHKVWGECINCHLFPDCDETAMIREVHKTKRQ